MVEDAMETAGEGTGKHLFQLRETEGLEFRGKRCVIRDVLYQKQKRRRSGCLMAHFCIILGLP